MQAGLAASKEAAATPVAMHLGGLQMPVSPHNAATSKQLLAADLD